MIIQVMGVWTQAYYAKFPEIPLDLEMKAFHDLLKNMASFFLLFAVELPNVMPLRCAERCRTIQCGIPAAQRPRCEATETPKNPQASDLNTPLSARGRAGGWCPQCQEA